MTLSDLLERKSVKKGKREATVVCKKDNSETACSNKERRISIRYENLSISNMLN